MTTKRSDLVGALPNDAPCWRLLFLLVQSRDGEWWRGFLLLALAGLLLIGVLFALSTFPDWAAGVLGAGSLTAALATRHRRSRRR